MENFKWNEAVRKCFDNLDIDRPNYNQSLECSKYANPSLLETIGFDFASILMDANHEESKKDTSPKSKQPQHPIKISKLTRSEHETYLKYRKTGSFRPSLPTSLQKIATKVASEQEEFGKYALRVALENPGYYDYVGQQVQEYVKKFMSIAQKRLDKYVQKYSYRDTFPISCIPFITDPVPKCLHVALMQKEINLHLPECGDKIYQFRHSSNEGVQERLTLGLDPEIKKLVPKWKPDIVICLSSLCMLASNLPPYKNEWEVPMTVEEFSDIDGETKYVSYIEKPLPSKSLNAREMNEIYFKKAVKYHLSSSIETPLVKMTPEVKPLRVSQPDEALPQNLDAGSSTEKVPENSFDDEQPKSKSTSEFSHSSDSDEVAKNPESQTKPSPIRVSPKDDTPAQMGASPTPTSDTDTNELIIDDETFDESLPQIDGSSDLKTKKSAKVKKSSSEQKKSSTPNAVQAKKMKTGKIENVKSDIWKKSFSNEEKVTSFLNLRPKHPSITGLTSLQWSSKIPALNESSESVNAPKQVTSPTVATDDDKPETSNSSQDSITYGVTSDPVFERKINAVASSTRDEDGGSPLLSPTKRITRSSSTKGDESSISSSRKETRKRKRESRGRQQTDTKGSGRKTKRKRVCVESDDSDGNADPKVENSSDDDLTLSKLRSKLNTDKPKSTGLEMETQERVVPGRNMETFPNPLAANLMSSKPVANSRIARKSLGDKILARSTRKPSEPNPPLPSKLSKQVVADPDILGQILGMQKSANEQKSKCQMQESVTTKIHHQMSEKSHQVALNGRAGKSRFYSLWSFGDKRVLIRGTNHGHLILDKDTNPVKSLVAVRTKLEYQPEFGYEQLTSFESCREWVDLHFRPQPVVLLRCHVDPSKRKFVSADVVRDLESLRQTFTATGFNVFKATKLLNEAFNRLSNSVVYPTGNYLLSHKSERLDILVRKGDPPEKAVIYDLKREYANPGRRVHVTANTFPYIPLDPSKQLPSYVESKRLPMTFEPAPDPPSAKKPKKKKNKGRKKKKARGVVEMLEE